LWKPTFTGGIVGVAKGTCPAFLYRVCQINIKLTFDTVILLALFLGRTKNHAYIKGIIQTYLDVCFFWQPSVTSKTKETSKTREAALNAD
jgi:hypothetical protein